MRTTHLLLSALLLGATACGQASTQQPDPPPTASVPTIPSAPIANAGPAAPSAADPAAKPPVHADVAVQLVGDARYRFDPVYGEPATRATLDALWTPTVDAYMPDTKGGPFDALFRRMTDRYPNGMPDEPTAQDVADIASAIPRMQAHDNAAGRAQQKYRARFGDKARDLFVAPPAVKLALRFTNRTSEPLHIKIAGDDTTLRMRLTGPGAKQALGGGDLSEIYMCGAWATIQPGGHRDLPIDSLRYGQRSAELGAYWTQPGRYQLTVGFKTSIAKGKKPDDCGRGEPAELVTKPFTLDVAKG